MSSSSPSSSSHSIADVILGGVQPPRLKLKLLSPTAKVPTRANPSDAGLDLHSDDTLALRPGDHKVVPTGIAISIPTGYVAFVKPRSGLAVKHGIDVLAGVIDSSYRGEIKVAIINHGKGGFGIEQGDRIAQLVIQKIELWTPAVVDELDETVRGVNGFGSTGIQ